MIKSVHVVPSIYAEASGISYCVPKLCDALAGRDVEIEPNVERPFALEVPISAFLKGVDK